jgi:hypothetical protein
MCVVKPSKNVKINKIYTKLSFYLLFCMVLNLVSFIKEKNRLLVFENWVLRRFHNEELRNFQLFTKRYYDDKIRRMIWAGNVVRMEMRNAKIFWFESMKRRDHSEDLDVDGCIILKCIFRKQDWGVRWTGFIWIKTDRWLALAIAK